jgi:hypothetical protein
LRTTVTEAEEGKSTAFPKGANKEGGQRRVRAAIDWAVRGLPGLGGDTCLVYKAFCATGAVLQAPDLICKRDS